MTTRLSTITALAVASALSACAAPAPAAPLHGGTAGCARNCGYHDGGFLTQPEGMKLAKDAFRSCLPQ